MHVCAVRGSSIIRACATALPTEELKDGRATGFIGAGLSTMGVAFRGVMCVCVRVSVACVRVRVRVECAVQPCAGVPSPSLTRA